VLTEQTLKTASETYWEESLGKESLEKQMCRYVCRSRSRLGGRSLLEAELKWARDHDQIQAQPCKTLVLLVGLSPEPLLQSICVYQPKRLILVLNQWYGEEEGGVFAEHLQEGIEYLEQQGLNDALPEFINDPGYVLSQDDPTSVFKTLNDAWRDVPDAVIDITGGKKSMVAGAFLYAAYAGIPISYVDFDEYHPEKRRPYGYSCRIGEITNPYQHFALREWERVRVLYTDYKFREARKTLEAMWPQVKGYFPDETGEGVQTMLNVFHCYGAWDAGDYNQAYVEAQKIPSFTPPDAVEKWGKNGEWVTTSGVEFQSVSRFYEDTDCFRAYVCDELARIRRLIECNEDYLSAFLRAGGLNEVVMVGRLVKLSSQRDDLLKKIDERGTPYAKPLFEGFIQGEFRWCKISWSSLSMNAWWKGTGRFGGDNGWETFLYRRNELTHQYYSPPPEWAEDALAFVTANVEDFFGQPVADLNVNTEAISWGALCDLSGMSRYLPQSLRKETER